ncbi:hypothetical protein Tco_0374301 [Tanacetum coccineum]
MVTPAEKRDPNKYCEFHADTGHNTDECMQLRKQIDEMIKSGEEDGTEGPMIIKAEIRAYWGKYVTNVKQNMDISTIPYVHIYTHLKAYEPHAKKTVKKPGGSLTSIVETTGLCTDYNNMFQTNHEDAYYSDGIEGPKSAVAIPCQLCHPSSATNNPVNEVHSNDNQIFDNYQLSQEMHQVEHFDSDAETEIDRPIRSPFHISS